MKAGNCPKCGKRVVLEPKHIYQRHLSQCHSQRQGEGDGSKPAEQESKLAETEKQEAQERRAETNGLGVPPAEPNFYISPENRERLKRIALRSGRGEIVNVLIRGDKGCGKTTLARQFSATSGRPFYDLHCGSLVDPEQWFGKDRLNQGETWYRKARFIQAVETPKAVILLDEVNRAHPEVLNAIFGLLDWRRSIWSDDLGCEIKVAEGVVFFATLNEGEEYYGTNPLDSALRERFSRVIKLDYPPKREEQRLLEENGLSGELAEKLVSFAQSLRGATEPIPISTRQLIHAHEEIQDGASLREAVMTTVVNGLQDQSQEKQALEALQWVEENPYTEESEGGDL